MTKNEIEDLFVKVCINSSPAVDYNEDGKKVPFLYRRDDLSRLAKEAFNEGKSVIYTEPVNPKHPYGPQRRCEPKYVYKLRSNLTEDQYKEIMEILKKNCES